jgi:hypothetical protein
MAELNVRQLWICAAIGAAFWFAAAMLARWLGPIGAFEDFGMGVLFALSVPALMISVLLGQKLADLRGLQTVSGVALATGVASLLDGLAFSTFPGIYGSHPSHLPVSAWIHWGAGVGLLVAFPLSRLTGSRRAPI